MYQGRTRRGKVAQKVRIAVNGGGNTNNGTSGSGSSSDNGNKGQQQKEKEKIQVFCRLKPLKGRSNINSGSANSSGDSSDDNHCCMRPMGDTVVQVIPPERVNQPCRELRYSFDRVFDECCSQKEVFNTVALPLVESVLQGKNSLLFTYGVTGSGKTFTMTGTPPNQTGIMPRALDVIFNSIHQVMAPPNLFKPDKLNGFELQNEINAFADRQQQFLANIASSKQSNRQRVLQKDTDPDFVSRHIEPTKVDVNKNNLYAVFVTYVEIYNNSVFDLLEDGTDDFLRSRHLQSKIVREDPTRNMYVHGVTELEIKSPEEAFEAFCKGQKRKRMAQTSLNHESSRSHSVFTIRLVQALMDDADCAGGSGDSGKKTVGISQLSLVDLAGSERTNRTKNTGLRLREAGNINNSLMTLRTCLELLRENQTTSSQKVIPYRESRLTHLFKNYFEGEGQVSMIVCVNPLEDDYEENLHVLKFAEMSQEVQVTCPTPHRVTLYTPSGRRAAKTPHRQVQHDTDESENDLFVVPTKIPKKTISRKFLTDMPSLELTNINDDTFYPNLRSYFEVNKQQCKAFIDSVTKRREALTETLYNCVREAGVALAENQALKAVLDKEKTKVADLEAKLGSSDMQAAIMKRKLEDCERHVKKLRCDLNGKESLLNKRKAEGEKVKEIMTSKIAQEKEKMKTALERKLKSQKSAMEMEMRDKENKLAEVRRILSADYIASTPRPDIEGSTVETATPAPAPRNVYVTPSPFVLQSAKKMGMAVSNRRHRRSRSAGGTVGGGGDLWLEHRPAMAVPLNTVMQPAMTRRKSVTKLTDVKDITEKTSKYCLVTQQQDSDGDLETRLYKGDVIPTAGGGAQVMFNDVEVLRQVSPNMSPPLLRPRRLLRSNTTLANNVQDNCAVALEGHSANKARP